MDTATLDPKIHDLVERAERADGMVEVSLEEFQLLLAAGAQVNGIRNVLQDNNQFKSQCRMEGANGNAAYFNVYTQSQINL